MENENINPTEMGLCPHGQLPGICKICLETEGGEERQIEISEDAKKIGSEIARQLEQETGIKPYDVQKAGLEANEMAKIKDEEYWEKRSALFTTPLNEPVPTVDISQDVAATAKRLTESGAEGVQTGTF